MNWVPVLYVVEAVSAQDRTYTPVHLANVRNITSRHWLVYEVECPAAQRSRKVAHVSLNALELDACRIGCASVKVELGL
jgi:hypothetical protein